MKKIVWYLVVFFVSLCFITEVSAVSCSIVKNGSTNLKPGDTIDVTFTVGSLTVDDTLSGAYLYVFFDKDVFEYLYKSSFDDFKIESFEATTDSVEATFSVDNTAHYMVSSLNVITLTFKVREGIANQNSVIKMYNYTSSVTANGKMSYCGDGGISYSIYDSSSDVNLSSLTVDGGELIPKFYYDTEEYTVSVDYDVTSVIIDGACDGNGCKVTGLGKKGLKIGDNTYEIVVTAKNGQTRTYKIVVNRNGEYELDNNTNLKFLKVDGYDLGFSNDILRYDLNVKSDVDSVVISGVCEGISCTVSGTGRKYLSEGENSYEIKVISENGNERVYSIVVDKEPAVYLNTLFINGYELEPQFERDVLEYEVSVPSSVTSLDIKYVVGNGEDMQVEMLGNENFQMGDNYVSIVVRNGSGEQKIYKIKVVRGEKVSGSKTSVSGGNVWDNWYILPLAILVVFFVALIIFGLVYYYGKRKYRMK